MSRDSCAGYRFDLFEVRLDSGILLRNGHRVRIQKLPFQMLVALLENSGKAVSREELRKRLWNDRTFIELDNSLQVAVAKLREALGEQAADPRFIKTISREGYQFIGDAVPVLAPSGASTGASPVAEEGLVEIAGSVTGSIARTRISFAAIAISSAAIVVLALAALFFYRSSRLPLVSATDKIALGSIVNETGDPVFDGTLSTAFRFKLQESPYLSPVPDQGFQRLVKAQEVSATLADQLSACRTLLASVFVNGRIAGRAPPYRIDIKAWRCRDGRSLATTTSSANSQTEVLSALDQATARMRLRLGESESSLEKYTAPLAQATTSSLLALKSFTLGMEKHRQGLEAQSISDYKLAVDLDPQFALAYARLGTAYMNIKEYSLAKAAYQKAFGLRERTTDRERLYIAAHYYATVTGELPREMEAYSLWQSVYPRDALPVENLANDFLSLGQTERALELSRAAIRLDPLSPIPYALEARAYLGNGQYAELNALCNDPVRWKTDMVLFHTACYLSALEQKQAQNQATAMQREVQWGQGNPQESVLLEYVAWVAMCRGRLADAHRLFAKARENAVKNNLIDFVAELDLDEAGLDADLGLEKQARERTLDALRVAPGARSVQAAAALALARSGDIDGAQLEANNAVAQAPLNTVQNSTWIASTHAAIALQRHNAKAALQTMEEVRPYDDVAYIALSPAYYRGLALLEDRGFASAALAFQQVVDRGRFCPYSVYVPLSRLQLARALQLAGQRGRAEEQFHVLDTLWQTADADFPALRQLHIYEKQLDLIPCGASCENSPRTQESRRHECSADNCLAFMVG